MLMSGTKRQMSHLFCVCQEMLQYPSVQELLDRLRADEDSNTFVPTPVAGGIVAHTPATSAAALLTTWWGILSMVYLGLTRPAPGESHSKTS